MLNVFFTKQLYKILLLFFFVFVTISQKSSADNNISPNATATKSSGPYCGLYCLYTIMELNGQKVDFQQLVKPEYIGSKKGSSLAELKKALQDNKFYSQAVKNLTLQELRLSQYPVILHVKKDAETKEYDHYELFLGNRGDKAMIFDPPNQMKFVPFYELVPRWDGIGLIVSKAPIDLGHFFAPARKQFAIFATVVIGLIAGIRGSLKYVPSIIKNIYRKWWFEFSIAQSAGLVFVALMSGMVFNFVSETGFLSHHNMTEPIIKANLASFIPKVSAKYIKKIKGGSKVIIDARQIEDYNAGHIDGAINIPVTLCAEDCNSKLSEVEKTSQLVIYCQSPGCPYAEKVAAKLIDNEFNNITIYKGGWVDWKKHNNKH